MSKTPKDETEADFVISSEFSAVRYLKVLVTAMTVTTILGLLVLVGVVVMRFLETRVGGDVIDATYALPEHLDVPRDLDFSAVTWGQGWIALVSDHQIYIFDKISGELKQTVVINRMEN